MMDMALGITVLLIIVSTLIGLVFKRLHQDKCLKHFAGYMVTLAEKTSGKPGVNCGWKIRVSSFCK